ncbi:MAG TPA: alpha/beta hydrolase [Pseudolabrys sp.]|nr:alpha/beta hydrolase [Pseudolabrys sp.]
MSIVYRDMDQRMLDFQYNNRAHVADPRRYLDWYKTQSEIARSRVRHVRNIAYGPLPEERLDIFFPADTQEGQARPVVVFVHGGAWQHLDLASSSFAAETVTSRGAIYVALGFRRMPDAGSLDEMVAQVRMALAWLWLNIESHGGDPHRLHLLGHSSGAHLGAMAICTDWPRLFGLPNSLLRAAVLVSGIYDLEPVRLSFRNDVLNLSRADDIRNSPCHNLPADGVPIVVAFGELETAEFKRQARDFADLWKRRFGSSRLLELQGENHYETIETFIDGKSKLAEAAFGLFGI